MRLLGELKKGDVVVYDRVFLCYKMLFQHVHQGLHAVFRAKEKTTLKVVMEFLSQKENDVVKTIECKGMGTVTIRLVRYFIKGKPYCLVTTLLDRKRYTIKALKEVYHARWGVEEFFKLSKNYLGIENFHSRTLEGIKQEIGAHFAIINLAQTMANLVEDGFCTNRHNCINLITEHIERLFLSSLIHLKKHFLPVFIAMIRRCVTPKRPGRSYPRVSKKPINRWQRNPSRGCSRQEKRGKEL